MADVRGDRLSFEGWTRSCGLCGLQSRFRRPGSLVRGWIRDELEQAAGPLDALDGVPE